MSNLPSSFVSKMKTYLMDESELFFNALKDDPNTSIRFNKSKNHTQLGPNIIDQIPWCPHAFFLKERPVFTLDPNFHAGSFYVQESSSMFIFHVLQKIFKEEKGNLKFLDLCASPGGKSTLLLDFLKGNGVLIANEAIQGRVGTLVENIMKWGYKNAIITNNDSSHFSKNYAHFFDAVIVDAPCSGEGLFRKDINAIKEWSEDHVVHCSIRQKRILHEAIKTVKHNGYLIYSTCTYNDAENMDNVKWLVEQGFESVEIPFQEEWGITKRDDDGYIGYQFYPHKVKGEGFFLAVLKNNVPASEHYIKQYSSLREPEPNELKLINEWIEIDDADAIGISNSNDVYLYNRATWNVVNIALQNLRVKYSGVKVGAVNKTILIPHHALALSNDIKIKKPKMELDENTAISFLRKELTKVESTERGWSLATYNDNGLGWFKNLGNRINNYFPAELRIRLRKN